jgi:hypothetical protein
MPDRLLLLLLLLLLAVVIFLSALARLLHDDIGN